MAYMQLTDYRTDLQSALGERGLANSQLDRWINFAYLDLIGAVQFPELTEEDTTQSTVAGQNYINVPTGAMLIQLVRNVTDDAKLSWVPLTEYWRLPQTSAVPTKWSRQKAKIMLNGVPSGIKSMQIIYIKSPTRLSGATDVIALTDTWDDAVFLLSVHHGLLALGEEQRAAAWFNRAASYITSRMTEEGLTATTPGLGLTLPFVAQKAVAEQMGG